MCFHTEGEMSPRGNQLCLMWCVGPDKILGQRKQEVPSHLSTAHITAAFNTASQKQWLHCTEELRILLFLLLQDQHLWSSSRRALQCSGEDLFQHKRLLPPGSPDLSCTGCFQRQQFNSHCWHFPFSVLPSCDFWTKPSAVEENTE